MSLFQENKGGNTKSIDFFTCGKYKDSKLDDFDDKISENIKFISDLDISSVKDIKELAKSIGECYCLINKSYGNTAIKEILYETVGQIINNEQGTLFLESFQEATEDLSYFILHIPKKEIRNKIFEKINLDKFFSSAGIDIFESLSTNGKNIITQRFIEKKDLLSLETYSAHIDFSVNSHESDLGGIMDKESVLKYPTLGYFVYNSLKQAERNILDNSLLSYSIEAEKYFDFDSNKIIFPCDIIDDAYVGFYNRPSLNISDDDTIEHYESLGYLYNDSIELFSDDEGNEVTLSEALIQMEENENEDFGENIIYTELDIENTSLISLEDHHDDVCFKYDDFEDIEDIVTDFINPVREVFFDDEYKGEYDELDEDTSIDLIYSVLSKIYKDGNIDMFLRKDLTGELYDICDQSLHSVLDRYSLVEREKIYHKIFGFQYTESTLSNIKFSDSFVKATGEYIINVTKEIKEDTSIDSSLFYDFKNIQSGTTRPSLSTFFHSSISTSPVETSMSNSIHILSQKYFSHSTQDKSIIKGFLKTHGKKEFILMHFKDNSIKDLGNLEEYKKEIIENKNELIDCFIQWSTESFAYGTIGSSIDDIFSILPLDIKFEVLSSIVHSRENWKDKSILSIHNNQRDLNYGTSFLSILIKNSSNTHILLDYLNKNISPYFTLRIINNFNNEDKEFALSSLFEDKTILKLVFKEFSSLLDGIEGVNEKLCVQIYNYSIEHNIDINVNILKNTLNYSTNAQEYSSRARYIISKGHFKTLSISLFENEWKFVSEGNRLYTDLLKEGSIGECLIMEDKIEYPKRFIKLINNLNKENLNETIQFMEGKKLNNLLECIIINNPNNILDLNILNINSILDLSIPEFFKEGSDKALIMEYTLGFYSSLTREYNGGNTDLILLVDQYLKKNFNISFNDIKNSDYGELRIEFSNDYINRIGRKSEIDSNYLDIIFLNRKNLTYSQLILLCTPTIHIKDDSKLFDMYKKYMEEDKKNNFKLLIQHGILHTKIVEDSYDELFKDTDYENVYIRNYLKHLESHNIIISSSFKEIIIQEGLTDGHLEQYLISSQQVHLYTSIINTSIDSLNMYLFFHPFIKEIHWNDLEKILNSSFKDTTIRIEDVLKFSSPDILTSILDVGLSQGDNSQLNLSNIFGDTLNQINEKIGEKEFHIFLRKIKINGIKIDLSNLTELARKGFSDDEIYELLDIFDVKGNDRLFDDYKKGQCSINDLTRVISNIYDIFDDTGFELDDLYELKDTNDITIKTIQNKNNIAFKTFNINKDKFNDYKHVEVITTNDIDTGAILWTLENSLYQQYNNLIGSNETLGSITGAIHPDTITKNKIASNTYKHVLREISHNIKNIHKGIALSISESGLLSHELDTKIHSIIDEGKKIQDVLGNGHQSISKAFLFKDEFIKRLNNTDKILYEKGLKDIESIISGLYNEGVISSKEVDSINKHLFYVDISPIKDALKELKEICLPGLKDSFILKKSEIKDTHIRAALKGLSFNKLSDSEIRSLCSHLKNASPDDRKLLSNIVQDLKSVLIINKLSDNCSNERLNNFKTIFHRNFITHPVFKEAFKEEISTLESLLLNNNKDLDAFLDKIKSIHIVIDSNANLNKLFEYTKGIESVVEHYKTIQEEVGSHINDDFGNIDIDKLREQENTKKEYSIQLWNRHDIITNLNQGHYTHCCVSPSGMNSWTLPLYIVNENFNIVEIKVNNKIIGQAFCYIGANTQDKCTLVIDNVEINNTYSGDALLIKEGLIKYFNGYRDYIGNLQKNIKIGNSYNDIPIIGKGASPSTIIGDDSMYLDSDGNQSFFL